MSGGGAWGALGGACLVTQMLMPAVLQAVASQAGVHVHRDAVCPCASTLLLLKLRVGSGVLPVRMRNDTEALGCCWYASSIALLCTTLYQYVPLSNTTMCHYPIPVCATIQYQ